MLQAAVIFQNHMILQQGKEVFVWGKGTPGMKVCVSVQNQEGEALVDSDGRWKAVLGPLAPSFQEELRIWGGGEEVVFTDVAVGEVWIAGGQSNMEFYMRYEKHREEEFASCPHSALRFYAVPQICYEGQTEDFDYTRMGVWRTGTREDLEYFSAVGYYFQKELLENLNVPVGIIGCNWGGSSASAWMKKSSVKEAGYVWMKEYEDFAAVTDKDKYWERQRRNPLNGRGNPFGNTFEELVYPGIPSQEEADKYFASVQGEEYDYQGMEPKQIPGILYERMLKTIENFSLRGVIWYQGESDDIPGRQILYKDMLSALIRDWRELWKEEIPFLIVQLPGYARWIEVPAVNYPAIRKCQEEVTETVSNTWLCSVSDSGEEGDIHPKNKKVVGERLALLARGHVYGENVLCDAPKAGEIVKENKRIFISFLHAEEGLFVQGEEISDLFVTEEGMPLSFSTEIRENVLIITLEKLPSAPVTISFARKNWICVNLYNKGGIPAIPFEKTVF